MNEYKNAIGEIRGEPNWTNEVLRPERSVANTEEILAAYGQVNLVGEFDAFSWSGNAGLRYVDTANSSSGHSIERLSLIEKPVQDGGGVLPDIEVTAVKANPLTTALLNNNVIFDYATDYYYQNNLTDVNTFSFTDTDFQKFKTFVSSSDFSFETKTEKVLKEAMTNREEVIFNEAIEMDFKTLLADIEDSKTNALETHQKEIQSKLEDEIVKRYFYRDGLYNYYLKNDDAILAATELLENQSKYSALLGTR